MKTFSVDSTPFEPVSHDPGLMKKILWREGLSCLRHISHIVLKPGDRVAGHSHKTGTEVFYCVRGEAAFSVDGLPVVLQRGRLLVVDPGEVHEISTITLETELLYLMIDVEPKK